MWKSICWPKCIEESPKTAPKQPTSCLWSMWKDFQDQEEPEKSHDDTQQWRIGDRRNSDRFWKTNILKRLQIRSIEKGSRDWALSYCKIGENIWQAIRWRHHFHPTVYPKCALFDDVPGEYTVQHNQQLGEPCQGGAHLSVLWKKLSLESCSGEAHTKATRGYEKRENDDKQNGHGCWLLRNVISRFLLQDGEGDGLKSREGIPVTHYDEQLKEQVVAFAKATSQKEARDRLSDIFRLGG